MTENRPMTRGRAQELAKNPELAAEVEELRKALKLERKRAQELQELAKEVDELKKALKQERRGRLIAEKNIEIEEIRKRHICDFVKIMLLEDKDRNSKDIEINELDKKLEEQLKQKLEELEQIPAAFC